jgi:uncharacterized protein YukE
MSAAVDLRVVGDPAACQETADGLERLARELATTTRGIRRGVDRSQDVWTGNAADSFRSGTSRLGGEAARLQAAVRRLGSALSAFAPELSEVRSQMAAAREVAVAGGLTVAGDTVHAPPSWQLMAAGGDRQALAFQDVVRRVGRARDLEAAAHRALVDAIGVAVDGGPDWKALSLLGADAALAYTAAFSSLRGQRADEAVRLGRGATALMGTAANPLASERMRDLARRTALRQDILARHHARGAERLRLLQKVEGFVDPTLASGARSAGLPRAMTALRGTSPNLRKAARLADDVAGTVGPIPVLRHVAPAVKGVPLLGLPLLGASVQMDRANGMGTGEAVAKNATATVAGGVATSMATTALTASLAGGPATVIAVTAGIGVGMGVSYAWDHREGIGEAMGDAADAVGDALGRAIPDVDLTPW